MPEILVLNPLQRWLLARLQAGYCAMAPDARAQAETIDRFLLSRRGLLVWAVLLAAMAANAAGLHRAGASAWVSCAVTLLLFGGLGVAARRAWLMPELYTSRRLWKLAAAMVTASYVGVVATVFGLDGDPQSITVRRLLDVLWESTPLQLMVLLAMLFTLWVTASARRAQGQRELARLQLVQERDAAARQASEAQLRLLRAQIQPHFIFNTLSAVQHWVDTGDARASALLRQLTAFLRGSTELLSQPEVTLGQEAQLLHHYLAIMQARLGERLCHQVRLAPETLQQPLPPGLLITLVENAIEHGVAPALGGGEVRVEACRRGPAFELKVRNTGQPLAPGWCEGVGLSNSRERLRHAFGDRASLRLDERDGWTEATVVIGERAA